MDIPKFSNLFEIMDSSSSGADYIKSKILDLAFSGALLPKEIPSFDAWKTLKLDEACDYIQRGKSPKYDEKGEVLVISQKCVQWDGFIPELSRFINSSTIEKYTQDRYLRDSDILWNSTGSGTVGRTCIFSAPSDQKRYVADSHVTVLRSSKIYPKFLLYWTRSPKIQSKVLGLTTGSTNQQELNLSTIKSLEISFPSLEYQILLADYIHGLITLCDELNTRIKVSQEALVKARKSIMNAISKAQTQEEFSTAWNRIQQNWNVIAGTPEAIDLLRKLILTFAAIGKLIDSPDRHGSNSTIVELFKVCKVSWGNLSLTKSSYVDNGPHLAVSAAGPDGRIGVAEHKAYTPVLSAIGARCGTMFMPEEDFTAIKNTMTLEPNNELLDNWYLFYTMMGSNLPRRGSAQPFMSKSDIENFKIRVPSLDEQRVISKSVEVLLEKCDLLESNLRDLEEISEKFARSVVSESA